MQGLSVTDAHPTSPTPNITVRGRDTSPLLPSGSPAQKRLRASDRSESSKRPRLDGTRSISARSCPTDAPTSQMLTQNGHAGPSGSSEYYQAGFISVTGIHSAGSSRGYPVSFNPATFSLSEEQERISHASSSTINPYSYVINDALVKYPLPGAPHQSKGTAATVREGEAEAHSIVNAAQRQKFLPMIPLTPLSKLPPLKAAPKPIAGAVANITKQPESPGGITRTSVESEGRTSIEQPSPNNKLLQPGGSPFASKHPLSPDIRALNMDDVEEHPFEVAHFGTPSFEHHTQLGPYEAPSPWGDLATQAPQSSYS